MLDKYDSFCLLFLCNIFIFGILSISIALKTKFAISEQEKLVLQPKGFVAGKALKHYRTHFH